MKKLTGKDIFPFIHGVLSCSVNELGQVVFNRFTDVQKERYIVSGKKDNLSYLDRCNASSGVTLEMITNSSFIALTPIMKAACRPFAGIDCLVDDVLHGHWFSEDLTQVPICFELPEGTHKVQIFLPWSVITSLRDVVLDNSATAKPVDKAGRFLVFGDSITQGYIVDHPSCAYASLLGQELDYEHINQAIGGYWFDYLTLDKSLADYRPEFITVAYGTNDYSLMTTPENFAENCEKFTEKLVEIFPKTKILGILPIYRDDMKHCARSRMRDFKPEDGVRTIREIYERFPNITILEDNYFPRHSDFFAPDVLHPNDLGNMFYGKAVIKAVKEMLAK